MINKLKLAVFSVLAFVTANVAFADPEPDFDSVLGDAGTAIEGYITTALPIVGTVVVAGLAIWGIPKFVRMLRRGIG